MNTHIKIFKNSIKKQQTPSTYRYFRAINYLLFFAFCGILTACHNHTESDGHSHETTTDSHAAPDQYDDTPTTIASLTSKQIKTVGIAYSSVEMKELTATIKANGNLNVPNNNKANATSLYGGVIKTLNVQIGSYVRKGQTIATIQNPQFLQLQEEYLSLNAVSGSAYTATTASNSQYASAKLQRQEIENQIFYAQKEVDRQKELYEGNAGARKNLELAQSNLDVLRAKLNTLNEQMNIYVRQGDVVTMARLASIKQQLKLMGINPNNITTNNLTSEIAVASPISGAISNVFAKIGSYVDVSSPVAEIVDNGSLHLDLNVFEKDLPLLRVGQIIHFTLTNNPATEYDAVVFSIGTAFENENKTIPVHCTVKGNKSGLIDGMNVTGIVSLNNTTTPAVPNDAIVTADGKDYIFIVTDKAPSEEEHDHQHEEHDTSSEKEAPTEYVNFEKIEIIRGISHMGYTAVTFINDLPKNAKIVSKGAFFINAKLSNTGSHQH